MGVGVRRDPDRAKKLRVFGGSHVILSDREIAIGKCAGKGTATHSGSTVRPIRLAKDCRSIIQVSPAK